MAETTIEKSLDRATLGRQEASQEARSRARQDAGRAASQILLNPQPGESPQDTLRRAVIPLVENDPAFISQAIGIKDPSTTRPTPLQKVNIFNPKTKKNEVGIFNPDTGDISATGVTVGTSIGFRLDDEGNIIRTLPSGEIQRVSGTPVRQQEEPFSQKFLSPNQRKRVDTLADKFDIETKEARDQFFNLKSIESKIDAAIENPIGSAQLGAEVAKIFESGRLTDEDVKRYVKRNDLPGAALQGIRTLVSGTLREDNAVFLKDTMTLMQEGIRRKLNANALQKAKRFIKNKGIKNVTSQEMASSIFAGFQISPEERQALDWLRVNPNNPDAEGVRLRLQDRGLL